MNNRIEELAKQAGYVQLPGFDFANSLQEVFIQKFAELIVCECIEIVDASKAGFSQVPVEVALDLTAKNIKAYFGLK